MGHVHEVLFKGDIIIRTEEKEKVKMPTVRKENNN